MQPHPLPRGLRDQLNPNNNLALEPGGPSIGDSPNAIASFLRKNGERVQLAVIGASEADQLARLVGPTGHPLFRHPDCSVLVVRG